MIARFPEVADGSAVAHYQSLESPLIAENLLKQTVAATARVTIPTLIGTHHFCHLSFLHKRLEGRQIGFVEVARREVGDIELMAIPFRSTMNGKVLGAGKEFAVLAVGRSLESAHHSQSHARCEIRVFAIGFLSTPPTRVAEDVDIRCPERQALIHLHYSAFGRQGSLGTGFIAHRRINLVDKCIIEGSSHAHRDGEHSGIAIAPHSM